MRPIRDLLSNVRRFRSVDDGTEGLQFDRATSYEDDDGNVVESEEHVKITFSDDPAPSAMNRREEESHTLFTHPTTVNKNSRR